jgi:hypothetical protein
VPTNEDNPSTGLDQVLTPSIIDRLRSGDATTAASLAIGGENQWIELKERVPSASNFIKDLAAFANSGGGVLIVGVSDAGRVMGWRRADSETAVRQMREIADSAVPNLTHVREGQVDDAWLAWIVIESAHEPLVTAEGAYWRRTSNRVLRSTRVFVNNVLEDDSLADFISDALARAGIPTVGRPKERAGAWSWKPQTIAELVRANDVVLQLWTNNADRAYFNEGELEADLQKRGATLIPVVFGSEAPVEAYRRAFFVADSPSAEALDRLVDGITANSWIDFSALSPYAFESLVADLLGMLGFHIHNIGPGSNPGFDIKATYVRPDPFSVPETEIWLVETKLYQHSRVRLETIRSIIGAISLEPAATRGLLVTNSQISSVVHDYLSELERRAQARLRVMDGLELRRLIARFPQLVYKYFVNPSGSQESDDDDS